MSQPHDWLVQIPDHPSALSARLAHLPAHLSYNAPHISSATLVFAGPTLAAQPTDDAPLQMTGTVMQYRAASADEVWELVRGNPYAKEGVWDLDRASVTPFRCVVRTAL